MISNGQEWLDLKKEDFINKYSKEEWDQHYQDFYDPDGEYTMKTFENTMRQKLKTNVCEVTFTKVNGEERIMTCTLIEDKIPEEFKPKGSRKPYVGVISAFDINAEGWRSFKSDNVKRFHIL
jgi:hypothetical protein